MPVFKGVSPAALQAALQKVLGRQALNSQSTDFPAFSVCAWNDDNTIILATALSTQTSDLAGVLTTAIPAGTSGYVQKFNRVPGAMVGFGAKAGQPVFLSETPGLMTLTPPDAYSSSIIRIGFAEPGDTQDTSLEAQDLMIDISIISEA